MNTQMWENPFTERHLSLLTGAPFNMLVIDTVEKLLMCNIYGALRQENLKRQDPFTKFSDKSCCFLGKGAMAEVSTIAEFVRNKLEGLKS